jgi:hypothetical protein|tara:strand:- start:116 stop:280 length:165 start_codon:yes stop_codon:yes gene_type:complete
VIIVKNRNYISLPMTEQLFWNRVGWLQQAMLMAEDFEFRVIYFHKLQDLMKMMP